MHAESLRGYALSQLFKRRPWHGVPLGAEAPALVTCYVEIVPTDTVKYELDKLTGHRKIDRPQKYSSVCPTLYGLLPQTLCGERVAQASRDRTGRPNIVGDGDPMDVCVLSERPVADTVRPTAGRAIAELKALGIEPVMMTGDNRRTAEAVARQVGIERVFADVLPQDKAQGVRQLQMEGKFTAMVGDGVNDAPALAQADLGIAIGAGTDVAVETGDVVLMKSDPADVLGAIRLSKATVRKMKQNLFWAAIYNVIAIPIAAGVLYPSLGLVLRPEFGALAMSASSITVVSNALLLRREVPPS